jgi:hypothetical protein
MGQVRFAQRITLCPFNAQKLHKARVLARIPVVDDLLHGVPSRWITLRHHTPYQLTILPFPADPIMTALHPAVHR